MRINQSFNTQSLIWRLSDVVNVAVCNTRSSIKSAYIFGNIIGTNIRYSDDFKDPRASASMFDPVIAELVSGYVRKYVANEKLSI